MSTEEFLSKKLQQFSVLDLSLVKSVYFVVSLLIFSCYPKLSALDWWFYLVLSLMCAMPLWVHLFSQEGGFFEKMKKYLKTNNPSNQVLLFLSVFFFALMIGVFWPVLLTAQWWVYIIIMVVLAIKPLTVSWFW